MKKEILPFAKLIVSVSGIKYDFSGMTKADRQAARKELPTCGTIEYLAEELLDEEIVTKAGDRWELDEDALTELISEKISSDSEMCHGGFRMKYRMES